VWSRSVAVTLRGAAQAPCDRRARKVDDAARTEPPDVIAPEPTARDRRVLLAKRDHRLYEPPVAGPTLLVPLFWSNVALGVFNLLPAFPLDGGRVLRAAMALRMGRARATKIAAAVGKVMAALFVIAGLATGATMLAIIGLFVWFTASQESALVSMTSKLAGATVGDAMIRNAHIADAGTSVGRAAEQMLAEGHRELMVADRGRITGVVTLDDLASRMNTAISDVPLRSAVQSDLPVVSPTLPLDAVVERLEQRGVVLVGEANVIIGMLTTEQLATYAALH